jgi:hypothetical protein
MVLFLELGSQLKVSLGGDGSKREPASEITPGDRVRSYGQVNNEGYNVGKRIASRTCAVGGPRLIGPHLKLSTISHVEGVGVNLLEAFEDNRNTDVNMVL